MRDGPRLRFLLAGEDRDDRTTRLAVVAERREHRVARENPTSNAAVSGNPVVRRQIVRKPRAWLYRLVADWSFRQEDKKRRILSAMDDRPYLP
jgi:hypothetical protein